MNKKAQTDWVGLIILLLIVVGGVMTCYYLITHDIATCTKDPVKYAFRNSEFDFEKTPFAYAELRIYQEEYDQVPIFSKKLTSTS
jgi:hypothetical protein